MTDTINTLFKGESLDPVIKRNNNSTDISSLSSVSPLSSVSAPSTDLDAMSDTLDTVYQDKQGEKLTLNQNRKQEFLKNLKDGVILFTATFLHSERDKIAAEILPTKVLFTTSFSKDISETEKLKDHPFPKMKSKEFYKKKIEELRSYDELEFGIYKDLIAYCTPDDEGFSLRFVDRSLREMDSVVKQRKITLEKLIDAIEISKTSKELYLKVIEIFVLDDWCNLSFLKLILNYSAAAGYDGIKGIVLG
jgi:hypothetical protein